MDTFKGVHIGDEDTFGVQNQRVKLHNVVVPNFETLQQKPELNEDNSADEEIQGRKDLVLTKFYFKEASG